MADITVSNDVDTLLQSSDKAAIRVNAGLGSSDTVEFGGVVLPAGTTAEIAAVSDATAGQLMVNTDTNELVRFTSASVYDTLSSGPDNLSLNRSESDQGATDFVTSPQAWSIGGLDNTNGDTLVTSVPLQVTQEGRYEVKLQCIRNITVLAGHPNARIRYEVTGGGNVYSYGITKSNYATGQTGFFKTAISTNALDVDVYGTFSSWASSVAGYFEEVVVYIDNPADTTSTITFKSKVHTQYMEGISVEGVTITKLS